MLKDVFYITKKMVKMQAFVAGGNNVPDFAKISETISSDGNICYTSCDGSHVDCKAGDLVYYGGSRGRNHYLSLLDPLLYIAVNDEVFEKQPIYKCCLVSKELPYFLSDISIIWRKDHWFLDTPRLRIRVELGDYWIRDIDPDKRYKVPVISCVERDGYSFEDFWRCDENGVLIEKLIDFDKRRNSSTAPSK